MFKHPQIHKSDIDMKVAQLATAGIATTSMKLDFWANRKKHLDFKMKFYYCQLRPTVN